MAKLTLGAIRDIASRRRPWTIRVECIDLRTNLHTFWFATGRAMDEMVECGWGQVGAIPRLKLISYDEFETRIDEKLLKGYDYADTPYVRMSPGSLAQLGGATSSAASMGTGTGKTHTPLTISTTGSVPPPTTTKPAPDHVNPSVPPPFGLIRWLRPSKGGGWEALDSNKDRLLDLPLDSGKTMLRDFADTIEILT